MQVLSLEIKIPQSNQEIVLYPAVLKSPDEVLLIDCGYAGSAALISQQLEIYNLNLKDLTGIIISHDDIDHVGGLYELKEINPTVKIYASKTEAPYLSGAQKSLRLKQAEDLYNVLPEQDKSWALAFQQDLKAIRRIPVDKTFGFDSAYSENVKIINTPGHTPGHISIYLPASKTLIANDAVVYQDGELEIANPQFTLDLSQAIDSVKKIARLEIEKLLCYHGGTVTGNISEKLTNLLYKYI